MTKQEAARRTHMFNALQSLGFTYDECDKLRRISMTLQRWHELECGDSNDYASWAIERDGDEPDSKPYMVRHSHTGGKSTRYPIADRETGARKRLQAIIHAANERRYVGDSASLHNAHCDDLTPYVQGDPRGAALLCTSSAPATFPRDRRRILATHAAFAFTKGPESETQDNHESLPA